MSEKQETNCVCGHPVSEHRLVKRARDGKELGRFSCSEKTCDCWRCQPCLDWPDEQGWWWCSYFVGDLAIEIIRAERDPEDGALWFYSELYETQLTHDSDYIQKDTEGPARFVKLTEPNPFEAQP